MPQQLSTGFVIAGAYADKLRRVLFAQLRDAIKSGQIETKQVAFRAGELNRVLFEILVNKLKIDKGDVVRIRIEYDLSDGDIKWYYESLRVEAFRRVPDEEVGETVRSVVSNIEELLSRPVTAEEREWTERKETEVEREVARAAREAEQISTRITDAVVYGRTKAGELLAVLKDSDGNNIGLLVASPAEGKTTLTVVVAPREGDAYRGDANVEEDVEALEKDPKLIVNLARRLQLTKIPKSEAEKFIRSKMEDLF
jgi:hypothetical protein